MDIKGQRKDYPAEGVRKSDLEKNPFDQFEKWLQEAKENNAVEFNAMALATATKQGVPSCRMVLLKHFDKSGLIFYTNYESRKANEIKQNPFVSCALYWHELTRQVRVEGTVEKISEKESADYFSTRPKGSQTAAWTSHQDTPILSRKTLETDYLKFENKFKNQEPPLPPYWGGYRITPIRFEFWQGRQNRLHDRFEYKLKNDHWSIQRLSP